MQKKVTYSILFLLIFSLSLTSANALPGTCKNPNGGNYCNQHSGVSNCWCDTACLNYGDCCDDYQEVCGASTGTCNDSDGGANYYVKGTATSSGGSSLTDDCVKNNVNGVLQNTGELLEAVCSGASPKYISYKCPDSCNNGACFSETFVCGNNICEEGEANDCPACTNNPLSGSNLPLCSDVCKVGTCPQDCPQNVTSKFVLENYPNMFLTNGKFNGVIVVGDYTPADDVIAATDIIQSLQPFGVGPGKLASEVASLNQNIISVGSSCTNAITGKIEGNPADCKQGLSTGQGKIKIQAYNGFAHLIVEGYSSHDTRIAANILAHYKDYNLAGTEYNFFSANTINGTAFVKETITCVFKNSNQIQKCSFTLKYDGQYHPFGCTGISQCTFSVEGPKGIEQAIDSSCIDTEDFITLDGKDEVHYFTCNPQITKANVIDWINNNCNTPITYPVVGTGAVIKKAPIIIP